ncbi:jg24977 [Pararge aegeria aegeria]|uniref:Jg24977 protein n=1 Tax=Pararge aegeria aegeria TaxID=348720 RepID=A0A8S4S567_9NEOP|nr:jg24977 [Pararge aegeria aegeria]
MLERATAEFLAVFFFAETAFQTGGGVTINRLDAPKVHKEYSIREGKAEVSIECLNIAEMHTRNQVPSNTNSAEAPTVPLYGFICHNGSTKTENDQKWEDSPIDLSMRKKTADITGNNPRHERKEIERKKDEAGQLLYNNTLRGRIAHSSRRETDVERGDRLCLFVARSALSLALQALNGTPQSEVTPHTSCFFVRAAGSIEL